MLAQENRLRSHRDFARVVRQGQRAACGRLVVHTLRQNPYYATSPSRVGLIVSHAVGNSVVRHQLSRRLRHTCRDLMGVIPSGTDIVIRALPGAQLVNSSCLDLWLREGIRRACSDHRSSQSSTASSAASRSSPSSHRHRVRHTSAT